MLQYNRFSGIFDKLPSRAIDTRPNTLAVIMHWPGHRKTDVYRDDMAKFSNLGDDRRALIQRHSMSDEFIPCGSNSELAKIIPIWCVIVGVTFRSYLELPLRRGPDSCAVEPNTDSDVAAVVNECVAKAGYDHVALCKWRKALAAMR